MNIEDLLKVVPSTRYQGSKRKILPWLYDCLRGYEFHSVLDAFGGSGMMSYLFKQMGKRVTYNDLYAFNQIIGESIIENNRVLLSENDVDFLSGVAGRPRTLDYAGRLVQGSDGEAVISFGKHKGRTARSVYETEPAYFAWIENGEFTMDTKRQFALLREKFDRERKEALSKPLEGEDLNDAVAKLRGKFQGGKLF